MMPHSGDKMISCKAVYSLPLFEETGMVSWRETITKKKRHRE